MTTAPLEPPVEPPPLDGLEALCDEQAAIDVEIKRRKTNKYRRMRKTPKFAIHRKLASRQPKDNRVPRITEPREFIRPVSGPHKLRC